MRDEAGLVERLKRAWVSILALKNTQAIGADSLLLKDTQTENAWDITGDVMLRTNMDSQWTVTFTPQDTSKPVYCEFALKDEITVNATPYDYETYAWDDPSSSLSNVKKFIVWRLNSFDYDQTIRMKFSVDSSQPGTLSWVRNR